ncbi:hypothetical protein GCM10010250_01130 [Streptomyces althioticus]|uniref:hypothetical protein n=1 Tax=Streptomyces althioticus TaxID=83380 RepID=UPI0018760ED6|nr:hypothetical protein GCM10010250_01130 [Streptomyces althioticus]
MTENSKKVSESNVTVDFDPDGTRVVTRVLKDSEGKTYVITHRHPDAITHHYHPGVESQDVPLYSGQLAFSDRTDRPYSGNVFFTWQPTPRIRMRGARNSTLKDLEELFGGHDSSDGIWRNRASLTLPLSDGRIPQPPDSSDEVELSGDMHVEKDVHVELGDGTRLEEVRFLVPNGWTANDASMVCDPEAPEYSWRGRTTATGDGWTVHFDLLQGVNWKELKGIGGYSFTHAGRILRTDGGTFTSREAISVLTRIGYGVSLALGRRTPCLLPVGYLRGVPSWTLWATSPVDPLRSSSDWLESTCAARQVGAVVSCVLDFTGNESNLRSFKNALAYYIAANVDVDIHLRAALPISGLQLLTYYAFVTIGPYTPGRWKNAIPKTKGTEWEVRQLLDEMGITLAVPRHFKQLSAVRRRLARNDKSGVDVLGAVIKMRNVATHPTKQQYDDYTVYQWAEAGMLANYWLCLALLYTVGYRGDIAAVLQPRPRNPGELRGTPWSGKAKKPWRVGAKPE